MRKGIGTKVLAPILGGDFILLVVLVVVVVVAVLFFMMVIMMTLQHHLYNSLFKLIKSLIFCIDEYHIKGFRPEWYISTMIYSRDIPFWLETLYVDVCNESCSASRLALQKL